LGNLNARRDWGHARDYVEAQWLILQQKRPEDYVIACGRQYSVRDFVNAAAKELGMALKWKGKGVNEVGVVDSVNQTRRAKYQSRSPRRGDAIVRVDPRYFRPTEVDTLLGDARRARRNLGWKPRVTFKQLVAEMVREDLKSAERDALVQRHGFSAYDYHE
jgi:GDPmannose 4,6-dehydratase